MGWLDEFYKLQSGSSNNSAPQNPANIGSGTQKSNTWSDWLDEFKLQAKRPHVWGDRPVGRNIEYYRFTGDKTTVGSLSKKEDKKKEEEEEKKRSWFEGWFEKGNDDVGRTILGTGADILEDLTTGIVGMGEKAVDSLAYIAPFAANAQFYQNGGFNLETEKAHREAVEQSKKDIGEFIAKDLYDEGDVARKILSGLVSAAYTGTKIQNVGYLTADDLEYVQNLNKTSLDYLENDMEKDSVLGEKSDSLIQSAGQLAGQYGLSLAGVPWFVTSGVTSFGGQAEQALNEGATYEEAGASAAISAGAEVLSEKLFGGDLFVGKSGSDLATNLLSRSISNKAMRTLLKLVGDSVGEGIEEVFSDFVSNLGTALYKEENLGEILFSEEALQGYIDSFAGGFALGGAMGSVNAAQSKAAGVDFTSGMTQNEQKVVDKLYKDEVASREKEGKVTQKEKSKIYDSIIESMERGDISIDTIEEVLGGESYSAYRKTVDSEDAIFKEYEELGEKQNATPKDYARYTELTEKVKDIHKNSQRNALRAKLNDDVMGLVKGSRLAESYNERARTGQKFEADVTQYDTKQQAVVQKAIDSGILNNSRRTHEFVDFVSKISADTGVLFDFSNTAKLREAGYVMEGQTIDGFYNPKEGITVNIDSPKSRQFVVGHEITHALEGTDLYDALRKSVFDYAKMKNQYGVRMESIQKRYKEGTDFEAELTADLVGEYIFSDTDFINNLSTQNRNVFQKVFDEIKYLCKVATAGSKEARELEKVKRAFEKAYREGGKAQGETKYSVSEEYSDMIDSDGEVLTVAQKNYFEKNGYKDENGNLVKLYRSADGGRTVWNGRGEGSNAEGIYLTDDVYVARAFASDGKKVGDVLEVYANTSNPLVIDAQGSNYMDIPMPENAPEWLEDSGDWEGRLNADKLPITAFANGHDAVIIKNVREGVGGEPATDVILRDSNQMKRTDNKNPTSDPDIRYSLSDSDGKQLTKEQQDYFKDSKMRDDNGNLKVMYHGSQDAGFHVFDSKFSDDDTSFFFVDRNDVAASYSGTSETYEAKTIRTAADPDIRYSLSEVTEEQNQKGLDTKSELSYSISNDTKYADSAIALNKKTGYVSDEVMDAQKVMRERVAGRLREMVENGVALPKDKEGDTFFSNSSYGGSEENTTICPRSLAPEAFMDAVSEYIGRPLTVNEQIYVSQDLMNRMGSSEELRGQNFLAQCVYCYVAADRMSQREFLGEYINQRDAMLQKVTPEMDISQLHKDHRALAAWWKDKKQAKPELSEIGKLYQEFLNGRKPTGATYKRVKMWLDASRNGKPMIDGNHLANIDKLVGDISQFGDELKPQIQDAWKYAQSASWAKKRVGYVAYNGHIQKWTQKKVDDLNKHYGLRMYSFSDFHPAFVLENMQMVSDAAVRGLKMLGYTKDIDFVEIFAPSGMNINVSTFGFEKGGSVYEDNRMGAEWKKAQELRAKYPNVGITFVATNDTMVKWAMKQDWIDVVIPYHIVKTGEVIAKHYGYQNYTTESSDTKTKEWKKGNEKYIAPPVHNNDLDTYLSALKHNGLEARFKRFLEDPETRPYYMKLVNECRQSSSESKAVQPIFDEEAIDRTLAKLESEGYYTPIGGSVERMYEIAGEVAESMSSQLAPAMSLSNVGEQHTPDSLSALRLTAEESSDIAPTVSETESVPVEAPIYESNDKNVPEGQTAMFEPVEERQTRTTRKEYHQSIIEAIRTKFKEKGFDFDKVLEKAKNLSTWSTVDNTPQRVMEKALGYKEGGILADLTVNKVAQKESEGIKWLNSYVAQLKQISKEYGIKPGSKESAAAQMFAEGFYVNDKNEIIRYGEPELIQDFGNADVRRRIKALARDPRIRKIYDDTLAAINESRRRNLYEEIPRLDNYFLHFRAMEDTFSTLGLPFNPNDIRAKDLPTDLNGVTADLKPGQPYFASAMHRKGKRTSFDLLGGVERYLNSAKNQIYHIDDIQTLRALRNYIAETYGQATGLEDIDLMSDAEAEERIKQVYGSHLSTFAKFLNEEANVLAGKTALIDRGIEGIIGRRGITFLNALNKQVGSNMVGYNVSSSLTNFLPVAQTFAKTNKFDFTKAFAQTVLNKLSGGRLDSFAEDSPVVIRRKGEDRFAKTFWQKLADPGYALMGMVDDISTEIIARTKYNEFTRKGMDSQKAHFETDKWVSKLMGDRSLGQQPQLYNSKMLGLVTKFQLEVRNQLDSQFYDTIQETKVSNEHIQNGLARNAKTAAKVASVFTQLAVAQHLYGMAFESIAGYNPAFDIIEVLMTAFGFDDEEDSEDTALDNLAQGLRALLEDLPYASTFTGGGRIPVSSAIPDVGAILNGEDEYGNEIGVPKAIADNAKEIAPYYLLPGGYGQAKKTYQGLKMFSDDHPIAGSYTEAGNLRFNVEDTVGNRIKAGVFGQYANENAQKYFNQEQRTLNPEQTEIFAGLDIPIEEYWDYRDRYNEFKDTRSELLNAAFADGATDEDQLKGWYVDAVNDEIYELYDKQKEIVSGNSTNKKTELRKLQSQMEQLIDGSKKAMDNIYINGYYAEVGDKRYDYSAYSGGWYEISGEYLEREQNAVKRYGITPSEYWNDTDLYYHADWYFDDKYATVDREVVANLVFGGKRFAPYAAELGQIKGEDKNGDGKTDSGTKKTNVFSYIDGLNVTDTEKMIMRKMSYPSEDKYNDEIVDYLNGRDDIDYNEMKSILEALGAKVDDRGYITW